MPHYQQGSEHEYLLFLVQDNYDLAAKQIYEDIQPRLHAALAAENWDLAISIEQEWDARVDLQCKKLVRQEELINRLHIESEVRKNNERKRISD